MALLTTENLDSNSLPYYDYNAFLRGRELFKQRRVAMVNFTGEAATCQVDDGSEIYTVTLTAENKHQVKVACDCPGSSRTHTCKHMVAAVLTTHLYIQQEAGMQWQYRLKMGLEETPRAKTNAAAKNKYAVVFGLLRERSYTQGYTFRLLPFRIHIKDWRGISELEQIADRAEQNQLLDRDRGWTAGARSVYSPLNEHYVINLPMEGVHLYNLLLKLGSPNYGIVDLSSFLPIIAKMDLPLFRLDTHTSFKTRLLPLNESILIEAALAREGENFTLQAGATLRGETFTTIKGSLQIVHSDPAWALAGRYVVPIQNPEVIHLLQYLPVTIPVEEAQEFREHFLRPIVERMPVQGDVIAWEEMDQNPTPRLYLHDDGGALRASLRFGYGPHEVEGNPRGEETVLVDRAGSWGMLRIHRHLEQETAYYQTLANPVFGLKRAAAGAAPGTFELRARTHPLDFLLHSIPRLTAAGFEIFGEESLKAGRLNRSTPTISLNITSGVDWFDVKAVVHYGEQEVNLAEIRRALKKQERYIKLADGSIGQIPEGWLNRFKKLFEMSEETEAGLRVRDYHLPLVDSLLEDADESQLAADFQTRRDALRHFERIQAQPVPQGFTGELRPYQKAGLDWLHFLYDYHFGGCLADDMGLGKTIQVLAFLQSLKEQGKRSAPTLLVVPKSLIANWQRETERFTPGLSILEFVGITRKKEAAQFEQYDIILTTYGTMLRDIEFLRSCTFLYVILDESQNIKNPLAQSSKAARLLKADHRLVMTGTPVENNTFELWSQFAFLNPGLLGSLETFRREFAAPIESRESDDSLQLLRRLVFPFILRRTKEQVAPELPERTERVLYTDLEPAQRKLYNHTREYYRGMLMGMLDEVGVDDMRMKILEGLLRLRQICIHPALVDSTYRGEPAKFEVLLETLETLQAEGHKALIFSQFVQTLHLLRSELDARHIRYTYLDGQTNHRQEEVDRFQNDASIPFFLISLKAGGVGLNLTAADYVIHIDPWWNPAVEMQAADRVHRIGQDKPVFVYKLIARNSIEEKILQLQEHKRELVDQLISSETSFFKSISKDDVKALFS